MSRGSFGVDDDRLTISWKGNIDVQKTDNQWQQGWTVILWVEIMFLQKIHILRIEIMIEECVMSYFGQTL